MTNVGGKLLWTGLFILVATPLWAGTYTPMMGLLGSIVMLVGVILYWMKK